MPGRRPLGVPDVIEARALGGRRLSLRDGLWSALITIISLGSGASAGREGPVVHLGATLSEKLCQVLKLAGTPERTLIACGVASAISASFNAPIAGVLFAHEVILGHYAMSAFVPIVMASAVGGIVSRLWFGEVAAFVIPDYAITSYWEIPAFALLGVTCAAVAVIFQFALIGTDYLARNVAMPLWARPAIGGLAVGAIAIFMPDVLGVGYETTDKALKATLPIGMMLALIVAKTAATAISLASRFGGGNHPGIVAPVEQFAQPRALARRRPRHRRQVGVHVGFRWALDHLQVKTPLGHVLIAVGVNLVELHGGIQLHHRKRHMAKKRLARQPDHDVRILANRPQHGQRLRLLIRFAQNIDAVGFQAIKAGHGVRTCLYIGTKD